MARLGEGDFDMFLDDDAGVLLYRNVGAEIGDDEGSAVRGGRNR